LNFDTMNFSAHLHLLWKVEGLSHHISELSTKECICLQDFKLSW
jgi:hypothetical protein